MSLHKEPRAGMCLSKKSKKTHSVIVALADFFRNILSFVDFALEHNIPAKCPAQRLAN